MKPLPLITCLWIVLILSACGKGSSDRTGPEISDVKTSGNVLVISDCSGTSVTISARVADPSGVESSQLWYRVADQPFASLNETAARQFFPKTCDGTTMLAPKEANWDGTPYNGSTFQTDAWRVVANIMMDWNLFRSDAWQASTFAPKYAAFFRAHPTGDAFTLSGTAQNSNSSRALQAQNALLGFALPTADARPFVQTLWDIPIPSGQNRYFEGMLYMLAFLHASGNFRLWY